MPRIPEIRNTHIYRPEPGQWLTTPPCAECGHPKANRVHDVAETPPEVAEIRDRMLGEKTEERTDREGDTP